MCWTTYTFHLCVSDIIDPFMIQTMPLINGKVDILLDKLQQAADGGKPVNLMEYGINHWKKINSARLVNLQCFSVESTLDFDFWLQVSATSSRVWKRKKFQFNILRMDIIPA